tara:strand:+ start:12460 stop:13719 length:1260 start_codon:yes stop_codon:yes gene_type:complete
MFWLVEDDDQLEKFQNYCKGDAFVEIIPYDNREHPTQNGICAIYIHPLNSTKGYMLPTSHSETLNIDLYAVKRVLDNINNIYVRDKKEFLHYLIFKNLLDTTLNSPTYIPELTKTHNYFYSKYPNNKKINRIIPIVKHYEYCEKLYNELKERINEPINDFYNNKATVVFNAVERSGIQINREEFESHFHPIDSNITYTQYNFKTLTTRPSNKFNGVNYAALNKDNGCRESFIPRNDSFIELDISAYHPTLLGLLVGYDFGDKDIHQSFAKMYGVDYQKSKELTFKQLYGGVFEQFKNLEFFQRVQIYVDDLWEKFNKEGYIECPISKYQFKKENLDDMKPQKLLNYLLQNLETAMNIRILWDIFKSLKGRKTKLVLYTYDSFLFDFDKSERDLIDEVKQIINNNKLQIKESYGDTYNFK